VSTQLIGRVTAAKSLKSVEVKWDPVSKEVYVAYAGWSYVGKADSASHAMNKAEAWLYDK
jgi:hypothetical protein